MLTVAALFRGLTPNAFDGPTLIAATQLTEELSQLAFPLNKSSAIKEPRQWTTEPLNQRVNPQAVAAFSFGGNQYAGTLRAKKAVGYMLWIGLVGGAGSQ